MILLEAYRQDETCLMYQEVKWIICRNLWLGSLSGVENVSMLIIWMILISILLVCPFLGVVLIKIDISLLLFVCGIYFSFLLGLLYDKYYSSEFMLLKASKRRSGLIKNMFLLLIFLV